MFEKAPNGYFARDLVVFVVGVDAADPDGLDAGELRRQVAFDAIVAVDQLADVQHFLVGRRRAE